MIKFTASGNGITIVGLGLEHGNLDRLKDGQPIRVKLSDLGFVGATGKDAVSMQRDLSQFIGPDTVVNRE
jgi:hypothetical protein